MGCPLSTRKLASKLGVIDSYSPKAAVGPETNIREFVFDFIGRSLASRVEGPGGELL